MNKTEPAGFPQPIAVNPWVVSDEQKAPENCCYSVCFYNNRYQIEVDQDRTFTVPMEGVLEHGLSQTISNDLPEREDQLDFVLRSDHQVVSMNRYKITIVPAPKD